MDHVLGAQELSWSSVSLVTKRRLLVQIPPVGLCCFFDQDILASLLSTGSIQENVLTLLKIIDRDVLHAQLSNGAAGMFFGHRHYLCLYFVYMNSDCVAFIASQ